MIERAPHHLFNTEVLKQYASLRKKIKEITNGAYTPEITHEKMLETIAAGPQLGFSVREKILQELKLEKNAIISVLVDAVWYDPGYVKEREAQLRVLESAFGVEPSEKSWKLTIEKVGDNFRARLEDVFKKIRSQTTSVDEEKSVMLKDMLQLFDSITHLIATGPNRNGETPEIHCRRGIGTAITAAENIVLLVGKANEENHISPTREQYREALNNAFIYTGIPLASVHLADISGITRGLLEPHKSRPPVKDAMREELLWDPLHFDFVKTVAKNTNDATGVYTIKIKRDFLERVCPHLTQGQARPASDGPTTRCPCMYSVEGRPAVIPDYFKYVQQLADACYYGPGKKD